MTIKELYPVTEDTSNRITIIDQDFDIYSKDNLARFVQRMESESKYFLNIYKQIGAVLWRGVKESGDVGAYESHSLTKRTPSHSMPGPTKIFDDALMALDFKALRRNSIFATGSQTIAESFGTLYIIVPKSSAEFTWGKSIHADDLIITWSTISWFDIDETTTNRTDDIDLDKFQKFYQFDQDDFAGAVRSGNEVLISGAYFAVHWRLWYKLVALGLLPKELSIMDQRHYLSI